MIISENKPERWLLPALFSPVPRLFWVLLLVGLACRVTFAFLTPVFYAPDEQAHLNYIQYLVEHRSFPVVQGKLGDAANDWEYCQPPLYYLLMLPAFYLAQEVFHDQAAIVRTLRLCSVLLWLFNLWFGVLLLRRLQIRDKVVWLFVTAMASLLPTYTFVSAAINNDNLLATLGSGLLYLLAGSEPSLRRALLLGLALGLALLTKQSAVVLVPAVVVWSVFDWWKRRHPWAQAAGQLTAMLGMAGLLFGPWMLRNWQLYGTFTPEYLVITRLTWPSVFHGLASAIHNLVKSFWAVAGVTNDIGYPFPLVGMLFMVLCVTWFQEDGDIKRAYKILRPEANRPYLAGAWVAVAVILVLVIRFGYLSGMGQGRYLFPVLYPIALLLAARWRTFPLKHPEILTVGIWVIYAVGFTVFSVLRFP